MKLSIKEIAEGWRNHLMPPEHLKDMIEEVSKERLDICSGCPFQSDNAKKGGYRTLRMDLHCTSCSCPLKQKTKSLSSSCPLNPPKWEAITTDAERYEIEKQILNETLKLQTGNNQSPQGSSEGPPDTTHVDSSITSIS